MSTAKETKNGKPENGCTKIDGFDGPTNRVADYIDHDAERDQASIRQDVINSDDVKRAMNLEKLRIGEFENQVADNIGLVLDTMVQATFPEITKQTVVKNGKLCRENVTVYKLDPGIVYQKLTSKIPATFVRDGEGFDTPAHRQYTDKLLRMMRVCFGVWASEYAGVLFTGSQKLVAAKSYCSRFNPTGKKRTPIGLEMKSEGGTSINQARASVIEKLRGIHNR